VYSQFDVDVTEERHCSEECAQISGKILTFDGSYIDFDGTITSDVSSGYDVRLVWQSEPKVTKKLLSKITKPGISGFPSRTKQLAIDEGPNKQSILYLADFLNGQLGVNKFTAGDIIDFVRTDIISMHVGSPTGVSFGELEEDL